MYFQFQCFFLFYTSSGYYQLLDLLDIRRLHQLCKVFHLETVTSLMWVEKVVLTVFFESLLGTPVVIYVAVLNSKLNNSCKVPSVKGNACLYCINCTKFGQLILRKIIKIYCHQMSYFKAKMHQIRFRLGLRPRPRWESLQRSPRPPSWI